MIQIYHNTFFCLENNYERFGHILTINIMSVFKCTNVDIILYRAVNSTYTYITLTTSSYNYCNYYYYYYYHSRLQQCTIVRCLIWNVQTRSILTIIYILILVPQMVETGIELFFLKKPCSRDDQRIVTNNIIMTYLYLRCNPYRVKIYCAERRVLILLKWKYLNRRFTYRCSISGSLH